MPTDLPENISTFGGEIDGVILLIFWIVGIWFVVAEAMLVYLLVRYRRKKGERAKWMPAKVIRMQAWVLVPVALVILCDLFIEYQSHGVWEHVKGPAPKHDVLVQITGRQFAWTFTYAGDDGKLGTSDDFQTNGELHVPRDKVVRFQLESADVLHSFWVPTMRLKQDAVPGRSIPGWFKATKEGHYDIGCAELCGASHTSMRAVLTVESDAAFARWSSIHARQQARLEVTP